MSSPIQRLDVTPHYSSGITLSWSISPSFVCPAPWSFVVETSETPIGPWAPFSPVLAGRYTYVSTVPLAIPKEDVLFFRVAMTAGGQVYYSPVVAPGANLDRRAWLIVREVMRNEWVMAKTLAGNELNIYLRAYFGPPCTVCVDPVTGDIISAGCKVCFGTGHNPGYHGPYPLFGVFNVSNKSPQMIDGQEMSNVVKQSVRLVGTPTLKKGDVLVDMHSDIRYTIDATSTLMEIRRVPVVQQVTAFEAPKDDPVYSIGR